MYFVSATEKVTKTQNYGDRYKKMINHSSNSARFLPSCKILLGIIKVAKFIDKSKLVVMRENVRIATNISWNPGEARKKKKKNKPSH